MNYSIAIDEFFNIMNMNIYNDNSGLSQGS